MRSFCYCFELYKALVRQNFIQADLGRNKAETLATRYAAAFGMECEYIPSFIEDEKQLTELMRPITYNDTPYSGRTEQGLSILIGAVDNNRSRKMCHNVFCQAKDLIYIDAGNGQFSGQVVLGVRRNGRTYYKPIGDLYPDVLDDTDLFPSQLSCAEAAASAPQSITANIMASTIVISYLYSILALGSVDVRHVSFSTRSINMKPTMAARGSRKQVAA